MIRVFFPPPTTQYLGNSRIIYISFVVCVIHKLNCLLEQLHGIAYRWVNVCVCTCLYFQYPRGHSQYVFIFDGFTEFVSTLHPMQCIKFRGGFRLFLHFRTFADFNLSSVKIYNVPLPISIVQSSLELVFR